MRSFTTPLLLLCLCTAQADEVFTNQFETLITSRINQITLMDPHVFAGGLNGCQDYTGFINDFWINSSFGNDFDGDGNLDLNMLLQFTTDQPDHLVNKNLSADMIDGLCPDPLFSGPCSVNQVLQADVPTSYSQDAVCLDALPGTTSGYADPIIAASSPCYATGETDVVLEIQGLSIPLEAYQQGGRYQGVLTIDQVLHRGFISEAVAQTVVVPASVPFVGGNTLYELLPGGSSCSTGDDRDTGPDGITSGWWFYFNSEADLVELN